MPFSLTARWVFPVASAPLPRGVVVIDGETIVVVEPHGVRTADLDLGDAAILPGLVNAHTHLDLSAMTGVAPPRLPLPDWLGDVIAYRRTTTPEDTQAAIRTGLGECIRSGTTLVGDIADRGMSWDILATSDIRATVYYELIGMTEERLGQTCDAWAQWSLPVIDTPTCRSGVSPHAPYSAARVLYEEAAGHRLLIATHLAESLEEMEFLAHRRGPFVDFLQRVGAWVPKNIVTGVDNVLGLLERSGNACVIAHGNYLHPTAPIPPNATVVYCPRTHAAFGHAPHPWRSFLARGVRVALGTDGLASNPDLNLLSETRFLRVQYPEVPGATLLRMATLSGAEALGWAQATGSLETKKSADLIVIPLNGREADDPHNLFLASDVPVARVMCRGRWLL